MQAEINKHMKRALRLARKAAGQTFPNPLVGAVLVNKGRIVGEGFHKKAGGPHAEILALKQAKEKAHGAALFCTFEPCAHTGRTGPCVNEVIKSGINNVYIGTKDPNPLTCGRGIAALRKAGVRVHVGFLEKEIKSLNEPFFKAFEKKRPFVTIKIAESLDGKIATSGGESQWITSKLSRIAAHRARKFYDCIMAGSGTVLADDPKLEPLKDHRLMKVLLDSQMRIPLSARCFKTQQPVIVAAVKRNKKKEKALKKAGVCVFYTKPKKGRVDLKELLEYLGRLEIRNVLVEGGATLIGSFLDERLADKAVIFIAPKIIGGRQSKSSVAGAGVAHLRESIFLKNMTFKKIADDILIEGYLKYPKHASR